MDIVAALALAKLLAVAPLASATRTAPATASAPVQVIAGNTVGCATVDRRTVKRCMGRNRILFECVNADSLEIKGAFLTKAGFVDCSVSGFLFVNELNDTCATVSLCGVVSTACLNDSATLGALRCLGLS